MTLVEIEELIRRYLSTGMTVLVLIVGPTTGGDPPRPDDTKVMIIDPGAGTSDNGPGGTPGPGDAPHNPDNTGADGTDPERSSPGDTGTGPERKPPDRSDTGTDRSGTGTGNDRSGTTSTGDGSTAAERYGWGRPDRSDDFSGTSTGRWEVYDGPGHADKGMRSPSAVSLKDGVLTITGDATGTTGGLAWNPGQKYGRWEGRVRAATGDGSYDALLLLWPDAEDFPVGGEIDFMEMQDPTRQTTDIFIHHGPDNSQVNGEVQIDGTEWHNWAVEWTPEAIVAYVDGEEWYRTTDTSIFPPGPMHLSIQLDWFPQGATTEGSAMMVDWVRQYSLDNAGVSPNSGPSGGDPTSGPTGSDPTGGPTGRDPTGGPTGRDPTGGPTGSAPSTGGADRAGTEVPVPSPSDRSRRSGSPGSDPTGGEPDRSYPNTGAPSNGGDTSDGSPIREAVRRMFSWW